MLKGTTFSGQPVFAQLTGMIDRSIFSDLVAEHHADRYCKRCKSWEHLMCMLYCIMYNCISLREVTHGIAAYGNKLNHLAITYTPLRSTLSDDDEKKRIFQFLINIFDMSAGQIGLLYKLRWQIELFFKQLKQSFPLKYFLGDNENAIKVQIWCTLNANLLFTITKKGIQEKISFSNLVSFARKHLFSYQKLTDLIEQSEKEWLRKCQQKPIVQGSIFDG